MSFRPHRIGDEIMGPPGFTIDHLLPRSKGGRDNHGNKVLACYQCNGEKADRLPTEKEVLKFERQRKKPAMELRHRLAALVQGQLNA